MLKQENTTNNLQIIDTAITTDFLVGVEGAGLSENGYKIALINKDPKKVKVIGKISDGAKTYRFESLTIELD